MILMSGMALMNKSFSRKIVRAMGRAGGIDFLSMLKDSIVTAYCKVDSFI